jgi:hypothetical protein
MSAGHQDVERLLRRGAIGSVRLDDNERAGRCDGDPTRLRLVDGRPGWDGGERGGWDAVREVASEVD